jgi:hypothetical protein
MGIFFGFILPSYSKNIPLSRMVTIPFSQNKKPLDFSWGFCITGGSGEIGIAETSFSNSQPAD